MATRQYLAMTAAEIAANPRISPGICWMACHFDPHGSGLSDLPRELPEGALLSLDDSIPMGGHDREQILWQLEERVSALKACGVLLDFQRPGCREAAALAQCLSGALPCPVVVSGPYAGNLSCPVFLPPLPPSVVLQEYLEPWKAREIWLEIGLDGETIVLTEHGATVTPLSRFSRGSDGHRDKRLHCHYSINMTESAAEFTLWRTKDDLKSLLEEAEICGVKTAVGLFQELGFGW